MSEATAVTDVFRDHLASHEKVWREVLEMGSVSSTEYDQEAATMRTCLNIYGVDLADPVAANAVLAVIAIQQQAGIAHLQAHRLMGKECEMTDEEVFGHEAVDAGTWMTAAVREGWR